MAAGLGSRYGGLKQMAGVGPHQEALVDYSIYDAIQAGFQKIVFVVQRRFKNDFKQRIGNAWEKKVSIQYVIQDLKSIPQNTQRPIKRIKPWGTAHAIWSARKVIQDPFAVINADDFYGRDSFKKLIVFLKQPLQSNSTYAMVGFPLAKTLSKYGSVSRGVCVCNRRLKNQGLFLSKIVEYARVIQERQRKIFYIDETGNHQLIPGHPWASMNMWGFRPTIFDHLNYQWIEFFKKMKHDEKEEFGIPQVINNLMHAQLIQVQVIPTPSQWFGMTYPQDHARAQMRIAQLVKNRHYPPHLHR